jgi:predicted amidohydrolase
MASPADVELDATGKYLVPGLWTMHVHVRYAGEKKALSAHLATGVTGLRDMGSPGR